MPVSRRAIGTGLANLIDARARGCGRGTGQRLVAHDAG